MKVLFVNTNENFGGASRAANRIMRGVQKRGVDVQLFVKNRHSYSKDTLSIWEYIPKNSFYKAIDWIYQKIKNKWQYYKWHPYQKTKKDVFLSDLRSMSSHCALQKLDYDIMHLHWINQRFLDINELKKVHKPIVWTLHDSWPFTGICHVPYDCKHYENHCGTCPMLGSKKEKDLAYEVFEKKMEAYKDLDLHIVTPSRWLGECAKRSALFGRFSVTMIPNCIDTDIYRPISKKEARQILGLDQEKTYLLFGAMHATRDTNKGFSMFKEALRCLKMEHVELLLYGTEEAEDKFDLSIPVHVVGYVYNEEMMTQLYNAADVCVVPSLSENLSNTIMESLACGTPVVAFNIGGNGDMIDHMHNGYLAKERDCEDLAKGIEWCIENDKGNILGCAAREKVMANYTIGIVSEQYKKLYESLL